MVKTSRGPRLWENSAANCVSEHRVSRKDKVRTARTPKLLKTCWGRRLEKNCPKSENVDNPMMSLQDFEVRQSGRDLELQKKDLWIRPTDLSSYLTILVTIREAPFQEFRGRSSEEMKAREEKIEGTKKHDTLKNWDEDWNSTRWQQSSWTWTTSSSSSAWRKWSSDEKGASWLAVSWLGPRRRKTNDHVQTWMTCGWNEFAHTTPAWAMLCMDKITSEECLVYRRHGDHQTDGSHISCGSEVILIDPHKDIHDDEKNVSLWLSTSFLHYCHLFSSLWESVRLL